MSIAGSVLRWGREALGPRRPSRKARGLIEELTIVPGSLRTCEPSVADEIAGGTMGLAGDVMDFAEHRLFSTRPPSEAFASALHGFAWLRHLDAARTREAEMLAQSLLLDWIAAGGRSQPVASGVGVTARRVLSLLAHSGVALQDTSLADYDAIMDALSEDAVWLNRTTPELPAGLDRLLALLASVQLALCAGDPLQALARDEPRLLTELEHQFRLDGIHVSRHPGLATHVLLDLIPLRQLYASRRTEVPSALVEIIERLRHGLRHMRLGDGSLGRFQGMGATARDELAAVLSGPHDTPDDESSRLLGGYARLVAGKTVLLADVGTRPPDAASGPSGLHASPLAIELSVGRAPLLVGAGTLPSAAPRARAAARATAQHSTAVVDHVSALRAAGPDSFDPLRDTDVSSTLTVDPAGTRLSARHAGYRSRFGLLHQRSLTLSTDGRRLTGLDEFVSVQPAPATARHAAVHFRMHPSVRVDLDTSDRVRLTAANGMRMLLSAEAGTFTVEPGQFYESNRAVATRAVVLHVPLQETTQAAWALAATV